MLNRIELDEKGFTPETHQAQDYFRLWTRIEELKNQLEDSNKAITFWQERTQKLQGQIIEIKRILGDKTQ